MKLRIEQDMDAQSPSESADTGAFLVAWHTREFCVPPPGEKGHFEPQDVLNQYRKTHHIFFVEAYIHSGVVLALAGTGNFPDRQWDVSSNVGAIFLSKSEWKTKSARALKYAQGMIQEWNEYLSGDVWGCIIEDDDGNAVDSCWGFYGHEYAQQEGARMLNYAEEHAQTEACNI